MELKATGNKELMKKCVKVAILLIALILSLTVLKPYVSSIENYGDTTEYLNRKLENTNMLVLGSSSASFLVSLIPDDAGTPISNELAKISSYLLIVMSAILLEKFLITTIPWVAFTFVFPGACIFGIVSVFIKELELKTKLKRITLKLLIFSLLIAQIIPVGCLCGNMIEKANQGTIDAALTNAKGANTIVESMPDEQDKDIFAKIGDFFAGIWNSAKQAYEWAKSVIASFLSSVAVMLVTTIAIPIIILFAFIWAIKFLTRRDFSDTVINLFDTTAAKITHRHNLANRKMKGFLHR